MIIDIQQKRILLINAEYRKLMESENALELQIKDLELEKIQLERKLLEIRAKLDDLELQVVKDLTNGI